MDAQHEHKSLRRLCRWYRRKQRTQGLISTHISTSITNGITLNEKTVPVLEGIVRGDYPLAEFFSSAQLEKFDECIKGINQCLLVSDLIDCGIIQTLPPPEPSGEAHPAVLALLRGEDVVGIAIVPRPDVF